MIWIRLATLIIIVITSCVGLGYLSERWILRHRWRGWVTGLMLVGISLLWPVITAVYLMYDAREYLQQHPGDDAPGMVFASFIYVGVPFLIILSLALALIGVALAVRRYSTE